MAATATSVRPQRADARRNRERLLAVAAEVFAEQGLDVGVAEISRRSGVGSATLFRHFPTKDDLVAAVLDDRLAEMERCAAGALEIDDPWTAIATLMRDVVRLQARDVGLTEALANLVHLLSQPRLKEHRRRVTTDVGKVLERAQEAGVVREDLAAEDVLCLVCAAANAGCAQLNRSDLGERYLGVILDGMRPVGATPLAPGPPTQREISAACRKGARPVARAARGG